MEDNNFKHLEPEQEAPHAIRQEVETSLGFFRYAGKVLDLYLGKIAWLFAGLVRGHHLDESEEDFKTQLDDRTSNPGHHTDNGKGPEN